ncbi:hypothetical protein BGZ70_009860 [Mortierella alpina]|uniref:Uncharacterized protein n=1 Tax=Mortierella alpina TaxID=64518 RepID=A0A9P6J0G5_MORAP|nr:hypothetical protein BGZ70_009860 [Mortierella alpina]
MQRLATSLPFFSHVSSGSDSKKANKPGAVSSTTRKRLQQRAVEPAAPSKEARVRHLYTAYETILNSESQMPMFWNHHQQAGSKKKTRQQEKHQQDGKPALTNNAVGEDAEAVRQRAIDDTSSRVGPSQAPPPFKAAQKNLRDPRGSPQAQQDQPPQQTIKNAMPKKQPTPLRKLVKVGNRTQDKSTARARIEDGISTIKTMFDSVFGTETPGSETVGRVPDSIVQTAMPRPKSSESSYSISYLEHCQAPTYASVPSPCSVGGTDASETFQKTLREQKHTLQKAVAAAAVAKDNDSGNDFIAGHSSSKTKKSVIVINDHEYEHGHERADAPDNDNGLDRSTIPDPTPHMDPVPAAGPQYIDSENEEFILPFIHLGPPTQAFDFPGSDLFFSGTILQRILAWFALALFGLFMFLLVISYKMKARRGNTSSPLAFLQYMTEGLLSSPFAESSTATPSHRSWTRRPSLFVKSPTSLLGRSGSGAVLPEPVVTSSSSSSSSSKTGSVMTDLRRTSASQYHLQQQLQTAQVVHKAPV